MALPSSSGRLLGALRCHFSCSRMSGLVWRRRRPGSATFQPSALAAHAEVHFQHLADVHTGRNAQRVQHDVQRGAVGQEGHILLAAGCGRQRPCCRGGRPSCRPRRSCASGRCSSARTSLTPGLQLVAVLAGEDLDVHNDAVLAVGHAQGGVAHLAGLFAEDGAQQALLGGQLGLALRA